MTELGMRFYGGADGLYQQPRAEQIRALAYQNHVDQLRQEARQEAERERERRGRGPGRG
jgi:hypothetical protein